MEPANREVFGKIRGRRSIEDSKSSATTALQAAQTLLFCGASQNGEPCQLHWQLAADQTHYHSCRRT